MTIQSFIAYSPFLLLTACGGHSDTPSRAPKAEVLLVGVMHHIPDTLACNWDSARARILRYAPQAIAVEYVPTDDTASMRHFLGDDHVAYRDSVARAWGEAPGDTARWRAEARRLRDARDVATLVERWRFHALDMDLANRDLCSVLIHRAVGDELPVDTSTTFGRAFIRRHRAILRNLRESELGELVHPLAAELGITHLHLTDERRYSAAQSLAYQEFDERLGSEHRHAYMAYWDRLIADEQEALQRCGAIDLVNTSVWTSRTDTAQTGLLAHLGDPAYAEYVRLWRMRNRSIAERISAASEGVQRMAVFYGYMHVAPIRQELQAMGHAVKLLEEVE